MTFSVQAIDPGQLRAVRTSGFDNHGNPFIPFAARGWEPLRCCLRIADEDEAIALISYSPMSQPSPWNEVGPVYVHAHECAGYAEDGLPPQLRTGPRILRTYFADGALDYRHVTLVEDGDDLEPAVKALFDEPAVATVHVRALLTQCFTYAITRS